MKKSILISFLLIFSLFTTNIFASQSVDVVENTTEKPAYHSKTMGELVESFYATTGIKALLQPQAGVLDSHGHEMSFFAQGAGRIIMIIICFLLFYLAIKKGFEPLPRDLESLMLPLHH